MEKRDNEISMQSPGRQYFAMPGKQLRRETTSVKVKFDSTLLGKKTIAVHWQKARIHIRIGSVDLHFV